MQRSLNTQAALFTIALCTVSSVKLGGRSASLFTPPPAPSPIRAGCIDGPVFIGRFCSLGLGHERLRISHNSPSAGIFAWLPTTKTKTKIKSQKQSKATRAKSTLFLLWLCWNLMAACWKQKHNRGLRDSKWCFRKPLVIRMKNIFIYFFTFHIEMAIEVLQYFYSIYELY